MTMYCVTCGRRPEKHDTGWCKGFTIYTSLACYQALFADGTIMVVEAPSMQFAVAFLSGESFPTVGGGRLEGLVHEHGALISIQLTPNVDWSKDPAIGADNVLNVTNFRQRPTGLACVGDDS